ncbi:MAG: spore germination protein, partial [Clostridia bacterium]|nr:spore germination protein [Clostridia bacterium]
AYISSFISERKNSIFSQVGNTEKPDVVTGKLLEGRIAIIVDGSPIVLTVPFVLLEDLQDGYDYYSSSWRVSMIRLFRLMGALMTVLLPGAYVALQSYHYHLLPLKFMITLLSATSGIPFPPAIEMLVVLILFEILNQASLRMPRFLGISLSIVGAIVLGDTAVKAGLISSPAVLVTALSAIGIFCVPDQVGTLSILRFSFLCVSAVSGLFGITIFLLILVSYLASMESFSAPYLAPYAPRIEKDLKDALFKAGVQEMKTRPFSFPNKNRTRIAEKQD